MPKNRDPRRRAVVIVLSIFVVLTLVLSSSIYFSRQGGGGDIVATVNGTSITREELFDRMYEEVGESVLDNLVVETLVRQEASRQGVTATDQDIEKALERLVAFFGSEAAFSQALAQYNVTMEGLRRDLTIRVLAEKCLEDEIQFDEDDLKAFFEENTHMFGQVHQVTASHILVETEEEAWELLSLLEQGESFEDLAQAHSIDPGSGAQGGYLGTIQPGEMVPEFEEAAFSLEEGEVSDPVATSFGFHIVKVHERQEGYTPAFDEVMDEVRREFISQEASQMMPYWIDELKQKAEIQVFPGR